MNELVIRGAAGGGKGPSQEPPRTPVESPDSLRSISYAQVLDVLGEGEIEGLVNGLQSVYFDGVPVQNEDGSMNFSGVSVLGTTGTQAQARLPRLTGTASEHAVSVEVKAATAVTRSVTNAEVDAVRVRIAVPGLSRQDTTNGDIVGTSVTIAIDVQSNGGGYVAQPIGRTFVNSSNPAVTESDLLQIVLEWNFLAGNVPGQTYTGGASVRYQVQYRQVGAGSWTTWKTDGISSTEAALLFTALLRRRRNPTRSYTIPGLSKALYEARVVKVSGPGTVSLTRFLIGVPIETDTISGKTTSTYHRAYRIPLTGSPPWDIRVRRITADSTSASLRNKTYWDSYTELVDQRLTYPNTAMMLVSVDAAQFSAVPVRGYDVKLLRVKIPSNYDPLSRAYTGPWDGTFVTAWTDNPAWCFYDLMTNERYGLGEFLDADQVDKWALYQIGQYCDELVPDGYGHQEPRFTCNVYFQTQDEAYRLMGAMASIFRGMLYWMSGAITAVQDAPSDPVFQFTEANVEGGVFTYSGTAKAARHTTVLVMWNDPEDGYKQKPEYVEDREGIARYGVRQAETLAVGCISRGQAHRLGEWLLYSEQQETETVMLRCGIEGSYLRPGDLFAVQDQHRAGVRFGGRVVAGSTDAVTLDHAITLEAGQTYTVKVTMPDGSLAERTVTSGTGSTTALTVTPDFTTVPVAQAVWVVTSSSLSPRLYRAITITEIDPHRYEVTGLITNPSKYDYIDRDQPLSVFDYSLVSTIPPMPTDVDVSESLVMRGGVAITVLTVSWVRVAGAIRYRVSYRRDEGNYVDLPETTGQTAELIDALPGFYAVQVRAFNTLQVSSPPVVVMRQIYGKLAPPSTVTGFVVARTDDSLSFAWQDVPDLDLDYYEVRYGDAWEVGVLIARTVDTRMVVRTTNGGTYLLKAIDTGGRESATASAVIIPDFTDINVIVTQDEAPAWAGVKGQTAVGDGGLTLTGQNTWDDLTQPWNTYTQSWITASDPYASGTYETVPVDLGQLMTSRVEVVPTVQQVPISGQAWDDLTEPWTSYTDPWAGTPGKISATYEMALSDDGSIWSAWQTYQAGHYEARAYKFRITLSTADPANYLPTLTSFLVTVDVPDRVLHFEDVTTSAGGTTITFTPSFVNVQTVTGTIQGGAIGDTFRVTGKTNSQATITVYNSAGSAKAGLVDVDVFGYGKL